MFCLKCGNELYPGEKFCPICGTPVPEQKKTENSGESNRKDQNISYRVTREERKKEREKEAKREKIILGVLGALIIALVIAIVGGVVWLMSNGNEKESVIVPPKRINMEEEYVEKKQEEEKTTPVTPEPQKEAETQVEEPQQEVENIKPEEPVIEQVEPEEIPEEQKVEENSSNGDFIISDSSTRFLTNADLNVLTAEEIRIARNEIFARHGRIFKSEDMNDYFRKKDWYKPSVPAEQFDNSYLNKIELENLKLITNYEKAHNMN